nr:Nramp family divalent metal transporter [Ktedonobacterales bacterium]
MRRLFGTLGPGLITGAADDDPSGIGTYAQAGASFGFTQLWLVLYLLPLMIAVQEMCGRIGIITHHGLAGVMRRHYPRWILSSAVVLVFVANSFNLGADLAAMSASVRLLVPGAPFVVVLIGFAAVILALEIFVPYVSYARVLKFLALALLAYVITGIIIQPDWGAIARATLIPHIQPTAGFLALVVGLIGTTISPYLFFWQASEEVEELRSERQPEQPGLPGRHTRRRQTRLVLRARRWRRTRGQLTRLRADTAIGMAASETVAWFIMITTGGTLFANHVGQITSADQAAVALTPLVHSFPHAGELARLIFALGIIGAGLLAVPTLAGAAAYATAEAFGWREGLSRRLRHAPGFYGAIAAATLVGLILGLVGLNPIQALVYAAVLNGIIAVPLLVLLLFIANNRGILG